jgi:hypothetical protein
MADLGRSFCDLWLWGIRFGRHTLRGVKQPEARSPPADGPMLPSLLPHAGMDRLGRVQTAICGHSNEKNPGQDDLNRFDLRDVAIQIDLMVNPRE